MFQQAILCLAALKKPFHKVKTNLYITRKQMCKVNQHAIYTSHKGIKNKTLAKNLCSCANAHAVLFSTSITNKFAKARDTFTFKPAPISKLQ